MKSVQDRIDHNIFHLRDVHAAHTTRSYYRVYMMEMITSLRNPAIVVFPT